VMLRRNLVVILACLAVPLLSAAVQAGQAVVISGVVTDMESRPIGGALVAVPAFNESAVSDDGGMYRLVIRSKVRRGQDVVVRASHKGFDYVSRPVRLAPKAQVRVNFRLVPVK